MVDFKIAGGPSGSGGHALGIYDYTDLPTEPIEKRLREAGLGSFRLDGSMAELSKKLAAHSKETTYLHAETLHNYPTFSASMGVAQGSYRFPEVEISGLSGAFAHRKTNAAAALLGTLAAYRSRLVELGVPNPDGKIDRLLFLVRGEALDPLKKHLKDFGLTYESIVIDVGGRKIESLYIPGDELLGLEKENLELAGTLKIKGFSRRKERMYSAPLNF